MNELEIPDDARAVNARSDTLAVVTSDAYTRHLGFVFLQQEVFVHVRRVSDVIRFRYVPDDHVAEVAARDEAPTAVIWSDRRDLAAVRLVHHVHRTTGLRVESADTAVTPAWCKVYNDRVGSRLPDTERVTQCS